MKYYVYIIGPEFINNSIKIGISNNPQKRLKTFQTAQNTKLKIWNLFEVDSKKHAVNIEKTAHIRLQKWKQEGEWFDVSPEMAYSIIDEIVNPEKYKKLHDAEKEKQLKELAKKHEQLEKIVNHSKIHLRYADDTKEFWSENWRKHYSELLNVRDEIKKLL